MHYRRPLRRYFWLCYHAALLVVWCGLFLPSCMQASWRTWGDDFTQAQPDHALSAQRRIDAHLATPFEGYDRHDTLDDNFKIVALSHMAYGYMNLASTYPEQRANYTTQIGEVLTRALDPRTSPLKKRPEEIKDFGDHNLYASHLNLILGIHRHITDDDTHDTLHTRLSKHLHRESLRDGDAHARSYPRPKHLQDRAKAYKWPADQSVTLLSLFMYDQTRDGSLSAKPIAAWFKRMKRKDMREERTGLPLPSIDDKVSYARSPRGCALSWTILYMSQFAPKEASELYADYRAHYSTNVLGFGGFREWPQGQDRGMDVDSGPIVLGVGMAATGIGLGATRLMRDARQYALVMRSATTFGLATVMLQERHHVTSPLLGEAILFGGATATAWFGQDEELAKGGTFSESEPWAPGNYLLLLILGAFIYYSLSSIREQWRALRR